MPSKTEDGATTAPPADRSLGDAINIATRSVHTKLNKLIILRLPLALPPQADDASNYVQGLLHIAPVYATFEALWRDIIQDTLDSPDPLDSPDFSESPSSLPGVGAEDSKSASPRIHSLLSHIHLTGLTRTSALHADLATLTGWTDDALAEHLDEVATESPALAAFLPHIREAVADRPHVLLAYAWVLYMALFSGGRFIRASLERVGAGEAFWRPVDVGGESADISSESGSGDEDGVVEEDGKDREYRMPGGFPSALPNKTGLLWEKVQKGQHAQTQKQNTQTEHPLSFFRFATPSDGEDLKLEFKARLAASTLTPDSNTTTTADNSLYLTAKERDDVVAEAKQVFERMTSLVEELDEVCGTEYEAPAATASAA